MLTVDFRDFPGGPVLKTSPSRDFPGGAVVMNPPANAGDRVQVLVWEDPTCLRAAKPVHHNY